MLFKKKDLISHYKSIGMTIGKNLRLFDPERTLIDTQNPKLIKIGDDVIITRGVIILTHDYSWAVLSNIYDRMYGNVGSVTIGNNVFIGMNSIILKNTKIGDNVIIGAGSVVSGNIESNSVYAGVPAKKIMSIDEYNKKLSNRQLRDIEDNYNFIKNNTHNEIKEEDFFEYFYTYKDYSSLNDRELGQINRISNSKKIINNYNKNKKYKNYLELIENIEKE